MYDRLRQLTLTKTVVSILAGTLLAVPLALGVTSAMTEPPQVVSADPTSAHVPDWGWE